MSLLLLLLEPGDAVASGVCMRWAGTAAGCVSAAVCLVLGDALLLLAVLLWRLMTAGEHANPLPTRRCYWCV